MGIDVNGVSSLVLILLIFRVIIENPFCFWCLQIKIDSSNNDDVGRTVAIIVGSVAGFAVLIVLLSFCRKAVGKFLDQ